MVSTIAGTYDRCPTTCATAGARGQLGSNRQATICAADGARPGIDDVEAAAALIESSGQNKLQLFGEVELNADQRLEAHARLGRSWRGRARRAVPRSREIWGRPSRCIASSAR